MLADPHSFFSADATSMNDSMDSVKQELEAFKSIRSAFMKWTLYLLPWFILATIVFIIFNYPVNSGTVMYITGLLTASMSLFTFRILMQKIPRTFKTIWDRKVVVECESVSSDTEQDSIGPDEFENRKDRDRLEMGYLEFIQNLENLMNSPFQFLSGILFSLFVLTWEYSSKAEFIIAFIIGIVAWKMIITAIYVWKMGEDFCLEPQLGHADKCGGLSPLGDLCLWNALIVTIPAVYLGSWIIIGIITEPQTQYFLQSEEYSALFSKLLFVPVFFAMVAFFLPLWSTHKLMLRWKEKKQSQLDHLEQYIDTLECKILEEAHSMDKNECETIFRERELMDHVYKQNKMIPVWPFNIKIIFKLLLSQSIPFFGIISQALNFIRKLP
ncbi:hypothetical protein [uncultured Methanolobus sp.]|uniref:hypothetical protein n=1 Tax=uncultured Methanolobus sp. TaxID=218300 RepID=UPI0029C7C743|nr:hypothetical protein [uncultured Methanolobus sp.]